MSSRKDSKETYASSLPQRGKSPSLSESKDSQAPKHLLRKKSSQSASTDKMLDISQIDSKPNAQRKLYGVDSNSKEEIPRVKVADLAQFYSQNSNIFDSFKKPEAEDLKGTKKSPSTVNSASSTNNRPAKDVQNYKESKELAATSPVPSSPRKPLPKIMNLISRGGGGGDKSATLSPEAAKSDAITKSPKEKNKKSGKKDASGDKDSDRDSSSEDEIIDALINTDSSPDSPVQGRAERLISKFSSTISEKSFRGEIEKDDKPGEVSRAATEIIDSDEKMIETSKADRLSISGLIAITPPNESARRKSQDSGYSHAEAAFNELIDTEQSYFSKLNDLDKHFIMGLKAYNQLSSETSIISDDEIKHIFLNVTEIMLLSGKLLLEFRELNKKANYSGLGKIFVRYSPFFRIYSTYTENFDNSATLIKNLLKANNRFTSFVKIREFCISSKLDSLRSLPIQRIPRYLLLLKEMAKDFPESCEEKKNLQEAIKVINKITHEVDQNIENTAAKKEVFFLQEILFKNKLNLITSSRYCVRYCVMTKMFRSKKVIDSSKKDYLFILFDDCLCYASLGRDKTATLKHALPLGGAQIQDIPDSSDLKNAFFIKTTHKSFVVSASNPALKNGWMVDIEIHAQILENNYSNMGKSYPRGDEIEKNLLSASNFSGKTKANNAALVFDKAVIQEKLDLIGREPIILLSDKQRENLREKALAYL